MKILFATEGENLESKIAKRFGHAPYYLIYDSETRELNVSGNKGHSDDHAELIDLVDNGVEVFILGNIGPHAFEVLNRKGAKMYLARGEIAREALEKFLNGELKPLEKPTLKRSIENHSHHG